MTIAAEPLLSDNPFIRMDSYGIVPVVAGLRADAFARLDKIAGSSDPIFGHFELGELASLWSGVKGDEVQAELMHSATRQLIGNCIGRTRDLNTLHMLGSFSVSVMELLLAQQAHERLRGHRISLRAHVLARRLEAQIEGARKHLPPQTGL